MYGGAAMAPQESRVERRTLSHFDEARYADTTICKVHNLCILDVCTTRSQAPPSFPSLPVRCAGRAWERGYVLPCFLDWMSTTISLNNSVYNFHLWAATIQGEGWFKKIQVGPLCQIEFRTALGWAHFGLTWSNARGHDAMTLQLRIVVENHSIVDILQWFSTVVIVVSYSATGGFLIPHQAWWLHSTTRVWERWKKVGTLGHMHTELSVYGSLNYMLVENATD